MSAAGGKAEVPAAWLRLLLLAKRRHSESIHMADKQRPLYQPGSWDRKRRVMEAHFTPVDNPGLVNESLTDANYRYGQRPESEQQAEKGLASS